METKRQTEKWNNLKEEAYHLSWINETRNIIKFKFVALRSILKIRITRKRGSKKWNEICYISNQQTDSKQPQQKPNSFETVLFSPAKAKKKRFMESKS